MGNAIYAWRIITGMTFVEVVTESEPDIVHVKKLEEKPLRAEYIRDPHCDP